MTTSRANTQVVKLKRANLGGAIEVLARALEQDPLTQFVFKTSDVGYQQSIRELFRFSCEVRFDL